MCVCAVGLGGGVGKARACVHLRACVSACVHACHGPACERASDRMRMRACVRVCVRPASHTQCVSVGGEGAHLRA